MVFNYDLAGLEFEWDDEKAESNAHNHGVRFEEGAKVFLDSYRTMIGKRVTGDGEIRHAVVGSVGKRLLLLVFTMRQDRIRIISARKAHRNERQKYRGLQT